MKFGHKKNQRKQPILFMGEVMAALMVLVLVAVIRPAAAAPLDVTMAAALDRVYTVHSNDTEDRFLGSAFLW